MHKCTKAANEILCSRAESIFVSFICFQFGFLIVFNIFELYFWNVFSVLLYLLILSLNICFQIIKKYIYLKDARLNLVLQYYDTMNKVHEKFKAVFCIPTVYILQKRKEQGV